MSTLVNASRVPESRQELLAYLETFRRYEPSIDEHVMNPQLVEANAGEMMGHVRRVMRPYVDGQRGKDKQDYYGQHVERAEKAFASRNFSLEPDGLTYALDLLVVRLDWE